MGTAKETFGYFLRLFLTSGYSSSVIFALVRAFCLPSHSLPEWSI